MAKIIAFIDASVYADSVCDHAGWVAHRMSAAVDVIHVLGRRDMSVTDGNLSGALHADARDMLLAELVELDAQKAKVAQRSGRLILDHASKRLAEANVENITTKLRIGDVVETMHEFESEADLIVIGKRGLAADFAKLHLGSNIERVIRSSSKPVLVTSREFQPIKRVLIAYDGGPSASKAVDYLASAHAAFGNLEFQLVKVGECTNDATARVEQATEKLRASGYTIQSRIVPGQPDQVFPQIVADEKIDLLVMGAYGHSKVRTLIIGSTTTEMLRSCKIPVVLFR